MDIEHLPSERRRVVVCGVLGLVAAAGLAAAGLTWQAWALAGWDVAAAVHTAWTWRSISGLDAEGTRRLATREDDSRAATRAALLVAGTASLAGVVAGAVEARSLGGGAKAGLLGVSFLGIVLAWVTVHTVYTLRYAHGFYDAGGGIDFPSDDSEPGVGAIVRPSYADFAYLAFTVGMTFQVADTAVTNRMLRQVLLRHALLSYLFNTIIIGITIGVLSGFIS